MEKYEVQAVPETFLDANGKEFYNEIVEDVYGLDYGINDPTVISVNALYTDGNWYTEDEYYQSNMSIQDINFWLAHFIEKRKRKPYATCQDPAGGVARVSLITDCRPRDAVKKIIERVHKIRGLTYGGRLWYTSNCFNHAREFKNYMFDKKNPEVPEDRNDHCMNARDYAVHTCYDELIHRAVPPVETEELSLFWQTAHICWIIKVEKTLMMNLWREGNGISSCNCYCSLSIDLVYDYYFSPLSYS
jgi:hypothetical protein